MGEQEFIWVKLTQEWGPYRIGDVIRFGKNKGKALIIDKGLGHEVPKQREVNVPRKRPEAEVATQDLSKAETAEVTPQKTSKPKQKARSIGGSSEPQKDKSDLDPPKRKGKAKKTK